MVKKQNKKQTNTKINKQTHEPPLEYCSAAAYSSYLINNLVIS